MDKNQVFELLEKHGIVEANIEYSGGGDEGDVNDIVLEKVGENDIVDSIGIEDLGLSEEEADRLQEALEDYVWDEYGGFTGGDISGTVIWNVEKRTIVDEGQEDQPVSYSKDVTSRV